MCTRFVLGCVDFIYCVTLIGSILIMYRIIGDILIYIYKYCATTKHFCSCTMYLYNLKGFEWANLLVSCILKDDLLAIISSEAEFHVIESSAVCSWMDLLYGTLGVDGSHLHQSATYICLATCKTYFFLANNLILMMNLQGHHIYHTITYYLSTSLILLKFSLDDFTTIV